MSRRSVLKTREAGFSLPELMIASLIGLAVLATALESLSVTRLLATRHDLRESSREQAEWILAYFSRQLRDASLASVSGSASVVGPPDNASVLRLEGALSIDCLGQLAEKTTIRKRFYLVATDDGLFDLRCSQQGGGEGAWTLASGLHGLSLVMAVDDDGEGVPDASLSPGRLSTGAWPMMATLAVPVQARKVRTAGAPPGEGGVQPTPAWWAAGDAILKGRPEDFEWLITSVRFR